MAPAPTVAAPTAAAPRRAAGSCTVARSCRPRRRLERVRVGRLRLFINRSSFADNQTWRHSHCPNSSLTIAARWPATAAGWPGSAPCTSRASLRSSVQGRDEAARKSQPVRTPAGSSLKGPALHGRPGQCQPTRLVWRRALSTGGSRLPTNSRITAPGRSWSWRTTDWAAEDRPSAL